MAGKRQQKKQKGYQHRSNVKLGCNTCRDPDQIDNGLRLLEKYLYCNAECAGDHKPHCDMKMDAYAYLQWQQRNLPALKYVTGRILDYIFSTGFTTGDVEADKRLDAWMYSLNAQGQNNYNVLRDAVENTMYFGHHGIRWLDEKGGLVGMSSPYYGEIVDENKEYRGFKSVVGYLISTCEEYIQNIDLTDSGTDLSYSEAILREYGTLETEDRKLMFLPPDEFLNLKWSPNDPKGRSPLYYDRQRLDLLLSVYERLNYDINYDGPGRILLHLTDTNGDLFGNEQSTSKTLGNNETVRAERAKGVRAEAKAFAAELKTAGSDMVGVVGSAFDKTVTHIPRVTRATEFFDYIGDEGVILCQVFGVPPALLELGRVFGNVSMQKIIDNAIMNSIIPIRERFATPISNFLAPKLGFAKIYFNKYDLEQAADEDARRKVIADTIVALRSTNNAKDALLADMLVEIFGTELEDAREPATLSVEEGAGGGVPEAEKPYSGGYSKGRNWFRRKKETKT